MIEARRKFPTYNQMVWEHSPAPMLAALVDGWSTPLFNRSAPTSTGRIKRERLVKANPFLERFTVADLKAWADRRMRGPDLRLTEVLAATHGREISECRSLVVPPRAIGVAKLSAD